MITSSRSAVPIVDEVGTKGESNIATNDAAEVKQERITQFVLFALFCILYFTTLCRTVYVGDSGEISNSIFTSSIIHPPGYPLFSLLGHIALLVVPFGEPAFRIGCVVALAAAIAVVVLYRFCRELGVGRFCSIVAAAGFGTCYAFWSQCVRVEVYSLHAVLYGLSLWGSLRYGLTGSRKHLYMAAVAFSLGLAHHLTIVLLFPTMLVLAGLRLWTEPKAVGRIISLALTIICVGPPFYLLLMYWAKAEPIFNWSRPITFAALYNHASAKMYQGILEAPSPAKLADTLSDAGASLADSLLWIGIPVALFGLVFLWRSHRQQAIALALGMLTVLIYNQFYQIDDILVYYLPAWWIAFALMAYGMNAGLAALKTRGTGALVASACCLLLPVYQVIQNVPYCNLSGITFVRDFARQKLEHCDKNAVLIVQNDNDGFPVNYMHYAMGIRPDVLVIDRHFLNPLYNHYSADPSGWYLFSLRKRGVDVSTEMPTDIAERRRLGNDGEIISIVEKLRQTRPLHTTFLDDRTDKERASDEKTGKLTRSPLIKWIFANTRPVPQGLVVRLLDMDSKVTTQELIDHNKQLWDNTTLPVLGPLRSDGEVDFTYFTHHTASQLLSYGDLCEFANKPDEAAKLYTAAMQVAPDSKSAQIKWEKFRQKYHPVENTASAGAPN